MSIKKTLLGLYSKVPFEIRHSLTCYNKVYGFYDKAQWWSKDEIERWQFERLKSIISYAYYNTDGYRQLYDEAGVTPDCLLKLDDIKKFPFTDKALLRDNVKAFTASSSVAGHLCLGMTGGSTGIPFSFYYDLKHADAEYAFIENGWASIGWKPKDIGVVLRGTYLGDENNIIQKRNPYLYAMSSRYLTNDNYETYMSSIEGSGATFLHVYPSTIADLSNLIIEHQDEGRLKIKQIFLGSENFYPWQKELVKKAFPEAKLLSWYGHTERAIWAPWCEKEEKYHLNPFYGFTEILNGEEDVEEGQVGELVGTSFWVYGTPFIRYRTNDFAEKGSSICEKCGRNFQLINHIDGRLAEVIVGKTGRRISLTVFAGSIMHGKAFEHIKQFRFVQEERGVVKLLIVTNSQFSNEDKIHIENSVISFLGDDFTSSVEIVDSLQKSKNGKFSYLEQHLEIERADRLEF